MPRTKKEIVLSDLEKKYIDICLKQKNINYQEIFLKLAIELNKPEEVIRDHANKKSLIIDDQLPPEPPQKELTNEQKMIRDLLTPNRHSEPNKNRHVSIMHEGASENLDKKSEVIKGSLRNKDCVFRQ